MDKGSCIVPSPSCQQHRSSSPSSQCTATHNQEYRIHCHTRVREKMRKNRYSMYFFESLNHVQQLLMPFSSCNAAFYNIFLAANVNQGMLCLCLNATRWAKPQLPNSSLLPAIAGRSSSTSAFTAHTFFIQLCFHLLNAYCCSFPFLLW